MHADTDKAILYDVLYSRTLRHITDNHHHHVSNVLAILHMQTVTCVTLREDEELRSFFETLVSTYLNSHSQYARIDILNCPGWTYSSHT